MERPQSDRVRRLLVIDDDDDIREVTHATLTVVGGWQVSTASSGEQGMEIAQRERPDAILLDVMMPDLDGPSTLERLQEHPGTAAIPVVLLTAKAQAATGQWPEAAGIIAKPFDPMTLPQQVAAALGWLH